MEEFNVKARINAIVTTLAVVIFLIFGGITAYAYNPPTQHTHAYSHWKNEMYYSSTADHHWYYDEGSYKQCDIVGYHYREILKCACESCIYGDYWIVTRHMQCGQW